ncbi:SymE family type I addiction module toxin [Caballeronia sordidicola]|uniref:SymE family type I addiction module toxin n=1 Tax=Caballeronia sordidicola TaxID=196367 RepID=UPI00117C0B54|nr:SymE family type I addiction module toxin [Caballeronia sordidicola]
MKLTPTATSSASSSPTQWSLLTQRPIPPIRLMGRWLEQAGFKPDSRVCVHVEDGRLVITSA